MVLKSLRHLVIPVINLAANIFAMVFISGLSLLHAALIDLSCVNYQLKFQHLLKSERILQIGCMSLNGHS